MKKGLFFMLLIVMGLGAMAQQRIQLHSTDKAECVSSDMTGLRASFSFSTLEAEDYLNGRDTYSWLSLPNTVIGGNEGDPQIPVINEVIAVPFGATPRVEILSYSSTDYQLDDLGMHTLVPRQPSLRKDQRPQDVPFVMNEEAYSSNRAFRSEPMAVVNVVGTMRGVRLGKLTIEPVSYDPVNNVLRVFNDIEVIVRFDGANAQTTKKMLIDTYSPYFDGVYGMLFNSKSVRSAYDDHTDLYNTPVKMLVVTTSTYANSDPFNSWLNWKKQKGFDVDVQTVASGASASTIKNLIYSRYNANHPTFLVIVGDETVVTYYQLWDYGSSYGNAATDLEYASVDGDVYHDMFISRIPVSSTTELSNYVNKALTYEKYTMADPSYLNNVLLIAGADDTWAPRVGRPTINYAADNYFNTAHGFSNVYKYVTSTYTGCYNYLSSGVGFANYTAHGDIQEWYNPNFTNSDISSLTNNDKYFWAMGNCCLTANFKNAQNSQTCFGEQMIRVANKGAFGYIGSVPESYWYEDYYFGVGATSTMNSTPSTSQTTTGVYDFMFDDTQMNTLNSVPFAGNVAVTYAHANSYTSSVTDEYYWRAYQCFGDGSIMPYHTQPAANNVTHANTISIGVATFPVSADPGSYVAITKNNEILGVDVVPSSGTVNVGISGLTSAGDVMIVVTRQQRQPYITTIQAIAANGPYISLDSYTPNSALIGETTNLSITFKNVGTQATSGTTTVTLTSADATFGVNSKTFSALATNATTTVSGFTFSLNNGVTLGSPVAIHYTAVNGSNTWEGNLTITPDQIYTVSVASNNNNYGTVSGAGQFHYNESCTVTATPADGYMFTSWTQGGTVVSTDASYTFNVTADANLTANFASGVMIGSGTTTNDYLPSYNYYNYTLSEQIYTSAELGGAGIITSIAFYNGGAAKTRNYDFYLKTTTKSSFTGATDWITVSASDKVFSGSVTMVAGDWTTITFSTPFVYDGTSNVVLVSDDNTGSYTSSPHMSCRVFSTSSSQALYAYNDGTNYNPLSPPTSSGSNNAVLSSKNQLILTKEALSTEPVNITVSANPSQAATVSGGGEYTFGQTCTVTATPNNGYTFTGWTENGNVVSSDLSFSFTAVSDRNLVANFIQAVEIGQGTSTHNYLPSYSYYNYSMTEQIYTASEIGTAGTINSIAFYNAGAERTRTYDFYLKSTTKSSFSSKTDWVTVSASDKVFSGSVTMAANAWTFVNFTTPFEYDGTSNLVLVADDNTGSYTSTPHMACQVYNANGNQSIYAYNDNTNFNPLSPPTSSSSNNDVLSVKNHILLGIEISGPEPCLDATEFSALACESYDWNGETYTVSGDYEQTFTNANGCDSVVTLHLTVNSPDATEFSASACESYDWNGETYTVSGDYEQTFTNANGCDSVVTLHLTVNHGTHNAETETAHESYAWNGETYTESGTYTFEYVNEEGCESTDTLHLTVTHCTPITVSYSENFDSYSTSTTPETGAEPDCWEVIEEYVSLSASTKPQVYRGFATSGDYSLRLRNRCMYAMPALDEGIAGALTMTFSLRQPKTAYRLQVGLLDEDGNFELVATLNNASTGIETVSVDFTGYELAGRRIAFKNVLRGQLTYDYSYNYIDDITLTYTAEAVCEIDSVPYEERFESYTSASSAETGVEPDCWEVISEDVALDASTRPQLYRGFATSGNYSLRMRNRCVYAMPALDADISVSALTMTFNLRQPKTSYRLQVGVVDADSNFVMVEEINNMGTEIEPVSVDFTGYTGTGHRIAFRNVLKGKRYEYSYNYIDDIRIDYTANMSTSAKSISGMTDEADADEYLNRITVYPNPTTGLLQIDAVDVQKVECYSPMGQLVGVYENMNELNLGELAKGVYMLRITVPQGVTMRKVVKR